MRYISGLVRSFYVPAIAFAIAAACCSSASAESTAGGGFGRLDFRGDSSPHTIRVWDSDYDVSDREWEIDPRWTQTAQAGANYWLQVALNGRGIDQDPGFADSDRAYAEAEIAIASALSLYRVPPDVREMLEALEAQVDNANDIGKQLTGHYREAETKLKTLGRVGAGGNPTELQAARKAIGDRVLAETAPLDRSVEFLRGTMDGLLDSIDKASSGLPPAVKRRVRIAVAEIMSRLTFLSESGAATVGAIGHALGIAVAALTIGYEVYSELFSDDTVIIVDETGSPVHADYPCRNLVRTFERTKVPNAVSCPAIGLPSELSLPFFGELGHHVSLNIIGGSGDDNVEVNISSAGNELSDVWVWGEGGNDTIKGSPINDILVGGPGNDAVWGKGGDDRLYGDGSGFGGGNVVAADARDTLLGGQGNDGISGEEGNDLILGGANSDTAWIGAALSGGPGDDVIAGGPGNDEMRGDAGTDTVLAKESDFQLLNSPTKQTDVYDSVVDCGFDPVSLEYVTRSAVTDSSGNVETDRNCGRVITSAIPSIPTLIATQKKGARWPWFSQ